MGRALFAAGGTGGHIFPARAAADELAKRGWQVRLVTDVRGFKHAEGFPGGPPAVIDAASPFQKNPIRAVKALWSLAKGYGSTRALMAEFRPDVVAGFGGYPAFPALAAARLSGTPHIIHEQNAVLGRVNRLFSRSAFAVASGFERLDRLKPGARHEVTGNPVREAVLDAATDYVPPEPDGPIHVLVIGGSLGARLLSLTVPEALAQLPEALRSRLRVVQQTRAENLKDAQAIYDKAGIQAELQPFLTDMGALYANAHLVISRAGASSVSEIAALGRPAIFVPLAIAMDDHQTANAQHLVDAGAAEAIAEADFAAQSLSARLESALSDGKALARRAAAARAAGRRDAHLRLAELIIAAAGTD
jgi:UDP-N-acetylglucosamine--N-acetylmuramyl-(pentapeptide) pyrophosphoryl-undecaprenol N-acetylglucosamine transferase